MRTLHHVTAVAFILGFAVDAGAQQLTYASEPTHRGADAHQQESRFDEQVVRRQFDDAVRLFLSPQHEESAAAFSTLIDSLVPRVNSLSDDLRRLLADSFFYRGRVYLNQGGTNRAADDIANLLAVAPDYRPDPAAGSNYLSIFDRARRELIGWISIVSEPSDVSISVDSRRARGTSKIPAIEGDRFVTIEREGYEPRAVVVRVKGGAESSVNEKLAKQTSSALGRLRLHGIPSGATVRVAGRELDRGQEEVGLAEGEHVVIVEDVRNGDTFQKTVQIAANETTSETIQMRRPPKPRRNWMAAVFPYVPRRLVFVRGGGAYQTYMEPFTSHSGFVIYGKPAEVSAAYDIGKKGAFDGFDLGLTVRVWKYLTIGGSLSKVKYSQLAEVEGRIPHPTLSSTRTVDGAIDNLHREEKALHGELGVTVGNERFEAAAFFGPSWLNTKQDVITRLTIREDSFGPEITSATGSDQVADSRIGVNLGADLSFMFARYAGVGATFRYVRSDVSFRSSAVSELISGGAQVSIGARFRY